MMSPACRLDPRERTRLHPAERAPYDHLVRITEQILRRDFITRKAGFHVRYRLC